MTVDRAKIHTWLINRDYCCPQTVQKKYADFHRKTNLRPIQLAMHPRFCIAPLVVRNHPYP